MLPQARRQCYKEILAETYATLIGCSNCSNQSESSELAKQNFPLEVYFDYYDSETLVPS